MRKLLIAACLLGTLAPMLPAEAQRRDRDGREWRDDRRGREDWRNDRNRDWNRYDRRDGHYDAARYYRNDNKRYRERRLGRNDRIYRGDDGRYYCRRDDGTTGLIIGALAGGVLGNQLDRGGSGLLGTILGAGGGGLIGRQIDRGDAKCR